jgi:hypothetical protein
VAVAEFEGYFGSASSAKGSRRVAFVHTNLEITAGPDNSHSFTGSALGEGRNDFRDLAVSNADRNFSVSSDQGWSVLGRNVRYQIAEVVRVEDGTFDRIAGHLRFGNAEAHEVCNRFTKGGALPGFREPRSDGSENIAPMKRLADRLAEIVFGDDMPRVKGIRLVVDGGEHAVIGSHEVVLIARDQYGPPLGAHARIDNDDVDGFRREILIYLADCQRAIQNVMCEDAVADVHDVDVGIDAEDDALHNRDKVVGSAVIGGQRDDRTSQDSLPVGSSADPVAQVPSPSTLTEGQNSVKVTRAGE